MATGSRSSDIVFFVPGVVQSASRGSSVPGAVALVPGLGGEVIETIRLTAQRGDTVRHRMVATPGKHVVVLKLDSGPDLVLHPEAARDLLMAQSATLKPSGADADAGARGSSGASDADPTEVAVPQELYWHGLEPEPINSRGRTRGVFGKVLVSTFQLVVGRFQSDIAQIGAKQLAEAIDGQVVPGVHALDARSLMTAVGPTSEVPNPAGLPILVLIHGTFSSTAGTFGKLWEQHPTLAQELCGRYEQRAYALEHETLSKSPIDNAQMLVEALPAGARLHLLTHSRGGLVAEVLARACALAMDDEATTELADDALRKLLAAVRERKITVERIVRVACPTRGTLLASSRLDAYLSVFRWTLQLAGLTVLPQIVDFLAAVAQHRTDPRWLPGLAAQIPNSPLIRWLHAAEDELPGQLRVVAGDLHGDSLVSWLKTALSDGFYRTDNDLVVQTSSMFGGPARRDGATFLLEAGGEISHFRYFSNKRTADAIVDALLEDAPQGFQPIGPLSAAGQDSSGSRGNASRTSDVIDQRNKPAVLVLPGIVGSHLAVRGKRIWAGWRLFNGFGRLVYQPGVDDGVTPDGVIGGSYDDLLDHLRQTHQVIDFPFDWRLPLEREAKRLASRIEKALDDRTQSGQPVRVLAHSMGGLLARTAALESPAIWNRMLAHREARFVMLGTPNGGSWAPMQVLSGDDKFGNFLAAVGAPFRDAAARQQMANYPGLLQLQAALSTPAMRQHETWSELARKDLEFVRARSWWHSTDQQVEAYVWGVPSQETLDQAWRLRERLDQQRDDGSLTRGDKARLVVGQHQLTPDGYEFGDNGFEYLNVREAGDGRVTHASAQLPGVPTYVMPTQHGDLADNKNAFAAIVELLVTGSTRHLEIFGAKGLRGQGAGAPSAPLQLERNRPSRTRMVFEGPPSARTVQAPPIQRAVSTREPKLRPLDITVMNGDLKFVPQPLLLGHYKSLTLTGSERAMDRQIGGTMKQALTVGRYPDEVGSVQIFDNRVGESNPFQLPRPAAVVIVGLGAEGKLRGSQLARAVRQGVIAWAQKMVEHPDGIRPSFEMAATLIGSGGSGVEAGQAAQWVAQGVHEANLRLNDDRLLKQPWPHVARLYLIEQYLDRAGEAWRALRALSIAQPQHYRLDEVIASGAGGLGRQLDSGYRGANYDLVSVTAITDALGGSKMTYVLDTRRARSEMRDQKTQGRLLRQLIKQASNDSTLDPQFGHTLFNLLVPAGLEPFLASSTEMLMEMDSEAASIPWELLDTTSPDACQAAGLPWAIRVKLLRRLRIDDYREAVIDADTDADALIIGEPIAPGYPRLAGAHLEALRVRSCLNHQKALGADHVVGLMSEAHDSDKGRPDALTVINALMDRRRAWRIVHIAGHGEPPLEETRFGCNAGLKNVDPRGVVLSDGLFLGPREIESMRVVPELVFLNCCHLGTRTLDKLLEGESGRDRPRLAATTAEALIKIGVRCVIAAGWAVDDGPAAEFAGRFYDALLAGRRFIDAVASARLAAWTSDPKSNTWAAYQCYGDPDWIFSLGASDPQQPAMPPGDIFAGIASAPGLVVALETLAIRASSGTVEANDVKEGLQLIQERLRYLEARFEARWGSTGAVAEAFGAAWKAANDSARAIEWFDRAVRANDATASFRALEQRENLKVRETEFKITATLKLIRESDPNATHADLPAVDSAHEEIRYLDKVLLGSLDQLEQLFRLQPTIERGSLLGSAWKRRALVAHERNDSEAQNHSLNQMERCYREAAEQAAQQRSGLAFYPAMNALLTQLVAGRELEGPVAMHPATLWRDIEQMLAATVKNPDFWTVVAGTELTLLKAIAHRTLAAASKSLLGEYEQLHLRVASPNSWKSVHDQLRFLMAFCVPATPKTEAAAIKMLLQALKKYTGSS